MAIYQCKECGGKISTRYRGDACPHCGYPIQRNVNSEIHEKSHEIKNKHNMPIIIGIVAVAVLLVLGGWIYFSRDENKSPMIQDDMTEEIVAVCDTVCSDSATIAPTVDVEELCEEYVSAATTVDDLRMTTYSGGGNGGGLGTELTIKFRDDKDCICISDFYCAFSPADKRTVKGTYKVKDGIVTVTCLPPDFDEPIVWEFELSEDGKTLSYDKSVEGCGTAGVDFMSLSRE